MLRKVKETIMLRENGYYYLMAMLLIRANLDGLCCFIQGERSLLAEGSITLGGGNTAIIGCLSQRDTTRR